ncbi:MAG: hypothetical protein HWN68_08320 [Desulfobacterales bacterium]|nr:hypothetical protein [Desulfobacterales bacterium]
MRKINYVMLCTLLTGLWLLAFMAYIVVTFGPLLGVGLVVAGAFGLIDFSSVFLFEESEPK